MLKKTVIAFVLSCAIIVGMISHSGPSPIAEATTSDIKLDNSKNTGDFIQRAIDQAAIAGGGDVYIPAGNYKVSNTIVIKSGVKLELSSAAMLVPTRDINIVEMKKNTALEGGIIYPYRLDGFTKSAIYLDGEEKFSGTRSVVVENVKLVGRNGFGNGLYFHAMKGSDHVSWVQVHNLNISGFDKAIHLKTEPVAKPDTVWINGNTFSQILISNAVYGIYLDGHSLLPYEISGNSFTNVQIQTSKDTDTAIFVKGTKNHIQAMIWDYHLGAIAIHFDEDSLANQINSNVSIQDKAFIDKGKDNLVVSAANLGE